MEVGRSHQRAEKMELVAPDVKPAPSLNAPTVSRALTALSPDSCLRPNPAPTIEEQTELVVCPGLLVLLLTPPSFPSAYRLSGKGSGLWEVI